jgi:hypothetical protein
VVAIASVVPEDNCVLTIAGDDYIHEAVVVEISERCSPGSTRDFERTTGLRGNVNEAPVVVLHEKQRFQIPQRRLC